MATRLIAGAMSGTSADGVDVAIVDIQGHGLEMKVRLVQHVQQPYEPEFRRRILTLRQHGTVQLSELAQCAREVALVYASAVREALAQAGLEPHQLAAIAAHGQTLFHQPPNTIQWIDPSLLAAQTGCPVVSDFRRADCAAGGQGAPLVPFADYLLFRHPTKLRGVVNIGGIANMTCLPPSAKLDDVIAFDTGPGNCISDYLMRTDDPGGPGIDIDGNFASRGRVIPDLFREIEKFPFFSIKGPKSTDGPEMIRVFLEAREKLASPVKLEDQLATAAMLTGAEIRRGLWPLGEPFAGELIVSGGGIRNAAIFQWLTKAAPNIMTTDDFGIPSQAKEGIAFALLGAATLDHVPANFPTCTGASRAVVLGSITPKP
jgi:anhydro-N-acetylmuramic acid kinase